MIADNAHAAGLVRIPRTARPRGRIWKAIICLAATATVLLSTSPVSAQYGPSAGDPRKKLTPRKKHAPPPSNIHDWRGLSVDLGVTRPLNSHILITNGTTRVGLFNLTGIHLAGTVTYLFQNGHFVLGPRAKLSGGWIESMPFDYTVRTNASATFGGEGGIAAGAWYFYAFGAGGAASLSAERIGIGRANNIVPAYELGAGFRYALPDRWYAKTELTYTTLGDQRLGNETFDAKPYYAFTAGFGFQFATR